MFPRVTAFWTIGPVVHMYSTHSSEHMSRTGIPAISSKVMLG